jgi:hypothetical protein
MDEKNVVEYQDQKGKRTPVEMLKALFGIPFGPGAFLTLTPLMAS